MNTLLNVARYHLIDRIVWVAMPWGIIAFSSLVNVVIFALVRLARMATTPEGW